MSFKKNQWLINSQTIKCKSLTYISIPIKNVKRQMDLKLLSFTMLSLFFVVYIYI